MAFIRKFDIKNIEDLKKDNLFNNILIHDCKNGSETTEADNKQDEMLDTADNETIVVKKRKRFVFPAVRNNRIDFYWKGGKLFSFDTNFSTHQKYTSVLVNNTPTSKVKDYISISDLENYRLIKTFEDGYSRIKENCSLYSGVEALGVSSLYERFSCIEHEGDYVVLDIEASFDNIENLDNKDRIDLIVLNKKDKILYFIEAKHYSNKEIRLKANNEIDVCEQIERYNKQINNSKNEILSAYKEHISVLNNLFKLNLPEPIKIHEKVILLVFGFDKEQKAKLDMVIPILTDNKTPFYFKGDIKDSNLDTIINRAIKK